MKIELFVLTFLLLSCAVLSERTQDALKDKVTQLDGYYNYTADFEMYSGYLTIQ